MTLENVTMNITRSQIANARKAKDIVSLKNSTTHLLLLNAWQKNNISILEKFC